MRGHSIALRIEPEDLGPARRRPYQAQQQTNRGRLACAVRAQVAEDLTLGDFQVEGRQRLHIAVALT
jgi:hypothetical protein